MQPTVTLTGIGMCSWLYKFNKKALLLVMRYTLS